MRPRAGNGVVLIDMAAAIERIQSFEERTKEKPTAMLVTASEMRHFREWLAATDRLPQSPPGEEHKDWSLCINGVSLTIAPDGEGGFKPVIGNN